MLLTKIKTICTFILVYSIVFYSNMYIEAQSTDGFNCRSNGSAALEAEYKWEELSYEEKLNACVDRACEVEFLVFKDSIDVEVPFYLGVKNAQIKYGGISSDMRGYYNTDENCIYIYSVALDYLDKGASTILHEYNAHQHNKSLGFQPKESFNPPLQIEEDTIHIDSIPFVLPFIVIEPSSSLLMEEYLGYLLEIKLYEKGLTKITNDDLIKFNKFFIMHLKKLISSCYACYTEFKAYLKEYSK